MSYHDNHPTDPEKQAARHAREEALIPPDISLRQWYAGMAFPTIFEGLMLMHARSHKLLNEEGCLQIARSAITPAVVLSLEAADAMIAEEPK